MAFDALDFIKGDTLTYIQLNAIKNNFPAATAPGNPETGIGWFNTDTNVQKFYDGAAWQYAGSLTNTFPVGTILVWLGGYFTNGSNAGYTYVLGSANTAAGANAYLNSLGWYVCNGAAVNEGDSPVWVGAGRYVPNLTDDRFIMGDTICGGVGGANTQAHTHYVNFASKTTTNGTEDNEIVADQAYGVSNSSFDHTHSAPGPDETSDAASNDENRPVYLTAFYIIRVF